MPRPKRAKIAPSAAAPRGRKLAKATNVGDTITAPKDGFNDMYDVSDPDEGIVTSARHVKKHNGKGRAIGALQMKSRVSRAATRDEGEGEGEIAGNMIEGARGSPSIPGERTLLEDVNLDLSSPDVEIGRRDRNTSAAESSLLIGNFRRRPRQPSILGRRPRSSSVESNLAEDNGLTSVGRNNTSAFGMGNFKRRKREPSIIGRNNGPARSSSIGLGMDRGTPAVGSALKIGIFRRRAREPSILGTAQKTRQPRPEYDDDDDDEDEDDFNPEDESTPLNLSKTRTMTASPTASSSNPRKRKLSLAHALDSSPELPSAGNSQEQEIVPATAPLSDESEEESEARSEVEEAPMPSIEGFTPEPLSETMAPPQSSSPTPYAPAPRSTQRIVAQPAPRRGRRPLRSRTPLPSNQDSPPSSPPSLTHSPNRLVRAAPKPRARRQPPPASTLSTAQLQALLPRRRRRGARDPFDLGSSEDEVDVSGLASDEDELTNASIRAPPRRTALNRIPAPLKKPSKPKGGGKSNGKATYSRLHATSDKENEEHDPDDSLGPLPDNEDGEENSQELEKRVGKELKRAARKFKEVDEWELEFEDNTASSSSPKDAR